METHDEDLVIICERNQLFGVTLSQLAEKIRSKIHGDKLRLEEHPDGKSYLENHARMIQNSLWVIHCEELLNTDENQLDYYLTTNSVPKATEIFVCIENRGKDVREELEHNYRNRIDVVTSEELLIEKAATYLNMANPAIGEAGKAAIKKWNNTVHTILEDCGV